MLFDYFELPQELSPLPMVGGIIVGGIIGFLIQLLSMRFFEIYIIL